VNHAIPPLTVAQLNSRLAIIAGDLGVPIARARLMLSTLVVSQMLPEAVVVKGGMGIKLRLGDRGTRATSDLDVFTRERGGQFEEKFRAQLAMGWGRVPASKGEVRRNRDAPDRVAFTGSLRAGRIHDPGSVPPELLMHPYRVTLAFLGSNWAALDIELSELEIAGLTRPQRMIDPTLVQFGSGFGFGAFEPVQVIDVEEQIAQKIHAVTDPDYQRAHDLVDLQVLWSVGPDVALVKEYCEQTFLGRRRHVWPPLPMRPMATWSLAYAEARNETGLGPDESIVENVDTAREWLTGVVQEIMASDSRRSRGIGLL
jgi:hypothetical protein